MLKDNSKRLVELDALRGIAALVVVIFHFTQDQVFVQYGFKFGITGVDLFFMISGFVILLTLKKTKHWQDFILNRFSRLFPVYWTCVTFTALLKLVTHIATNKSLVTLPLQYLANMTMFQLYFGEADLDSTYWTMIVEMLFYVLMLIIFLYKGIEHMEIIGVMVLIPIGCYAFIDAANYPITHAWISHYIPIVNHFPLFFAGILFYKIKFQQNRVLPYVLLIACFIIQLYLFDDGGKSEKLLTQAEYVLALLFYFVLFILYVHNYLTFIVNRVTIFFGAISYSLYLVHRFIGRMIIYQLMTKAHINFWTAAFLIALPIVIIIAWLINKFIEKPAMEIMRKRFHTQKIETVQDQLLITNNHADHN